jgi:peptide deformylase
MALLPLLYYPDERLHLKARPIKEVDEAIRQLADDMAETMYAHEGVGLAANQVNMQVRLIVLDTSPERDQLQVFINPELVSGQGEVCEEEGCLSVPGIYDKVVRYETVVVKAQDRDGKTFSVEAQGLLSRCLQHEMDHLEGRVFVEHLSQLKQNRIKTKLRKRSRETL